MSEWPVQEKKKKSPLVIIIIVIAVIFGIAIILSVVLAGLTFLWASSFTDDTNDVIHTPNLICSIYAGDGTLEFEMISGTMDWSDVRVTVDGTEVTTSSMSSSAGQSALFSEPAWEPSPGTTYDVKIIDIADNKVIWQNDILAT